LVRRGRNDGDAGLLHVGARYYDPAVGRWTSADKWLGNLYRPLSLNRYLYCEDDPVNYVDPSGHASLADWLLATRTVVAGIGGAVTYVNPVVGGAVAVVGTVVAAIGGGIQMGEYLGEACFLYPRKSQHHPQKTLTTTEGNSRKVGGAEKYPSRTIRAITPFQ
jgi:RHS repeat-associated protein